MYGLQDVNWNELSRKFPNKSVLYLGSESYDAPTITVLQGLKDCGFTIYTASSNINSWQVETLAHDFRNLSYDFVLSNLHWGTRFDFYDKYRLHGPYVLIDGDDDGRLTWREKYEVYLRRYKEIPPFVYRENLVQPYRWMAPLAGYKPDVVFTSQHGGLPEQGHYLPFGFRRREIRYGERTWTKRGYRYDFTAIPGAGEARKELTDFLDKDPLPGTVFHRPVYGTALFPPRVKYQILDDTENVHSWHRWVIHLGYVDTLALSRCLIYPGIRNYPHYDSKRPWEALGAGCLLIAKEPNISTPGVDWSDFAILYRKKEELPEICADILENWNEFDKIRIKNAGAARKMWSPVATALYVLRTILKEV